MKPTELRIGNYITDYYNDNIIVTIDILIGVQKCYNNRKQFQDIYKPIPLTEDWLKKFGFRKIAFIGVNEEDYKYWSKGKFQICNTEEKYYFSNTKLKYVHQLQNLYFALTGKELKS